MSGGQPLTLTRCVSVQKQAIQEEPPVNEVSSSIDNSLWVSDKNVISIIVTPSPINWRLFNHQLAIVMIGKYVRELQTR